MENKINKITDGKTDKEIAKSLIKLADIDSDYEGLCRTIENSGFQILDRYAKRVDSSSDDLRGFWSLNCGCDLSTSSYIPYVGSFRKTIAIPPEGMCKEKISYGNIEQYFNALAKFRDLVKSHGFTKNCLLYEEYLGNLDEIVKDLTDVKKTKKSLIEEFRNSSEREFRWACFRKIDVPYRVERDIEQHSETKITHESIKSFKAKPSKMEHVAYHSEIIIVPSSKEAWAETEINPKEEKEGYILDMQTEEYQEQEKKERINRDSEPIESPRSAEGYDEFGHSIYE